jgi:hypothetical protein
VETHDGDLRVVHWKTTPPVQAVELKVDAAAELTRAT